jgi:hypothetical protein
MRWRWFYIGVAAVGMAACSTPISPPTQPPPKPEVVCVWGDSVMLLATLQFPSVWDDPATETGGFAKMGIGLDYPDLATEVLNVESRDTCTVHEINMGTNDLHAGIDATQDDVAGYAQRFLDTLTPAPIVWITPRPEIGDPGLADAYDATIRSLQATNPSLVEVVNSGTLGIEWNTANNDPVHPTPAGALTLAQYLKASADRIAEQALTSG